LLLGWWGAHCIVTGEAREQQLDDLNVEFPLPDTRRYGEKTRYSGSSTLSRSSVAPSPR
jgi:carotenoid cleavage dioxygenase-like enzyme